MNKNLPFRYFKTSPEIIRLAVMYYVRFPLSLRQMEDILHERGIDVVTRPYATGGIDLDRCLLIKSKSGVSVMVMARSGVGIWMRCL